jgi:hypothetical protein
MNRRAEPRDAGGKLSKIAPKALAVQSAQTLLAKAK